MSFARICPKEIWQNVLCSNNKVVTLSRALVSTSKSSQNVSSEETKPNNVQQIVPSDSDVNQTATTFRKEDKAIPSKARFIYPEFLPDPKIEWRNLIREKLERMDMMKRRSQIDIPEFYVGSVLAVISSTQHAPNKMSRFVGICIQRSGCGLRSQFVLRNVVDNLGTEIVFRMYDPTLQRIEVLRLEKRIDNELFYLRDALPEYSTFPLDMEVEYLPEGAEIPVNDIKVKMKPRPWTQKWYMKNIKGIADLPKMTANELRRYAKAQTPWEKYDLMKQYRATIPEEEQNEIFADVYSELHQLELLRKKIKRKRMFVKPVKSS